MTFYFTNKIFDCPWSHRSNSEKTFNKSLGVTLLPKLPAS